MSNKENMRFDEKHFNSLLEMLFALMISHNKGKKVFATWETVHLKQLTQTTRSYKKGANPAEKAKTLVRLPTENKVQLVESWQSEILSSQPQPQLSDDDFISLNFGQMVLGKSLSKEKLSDVGYVIRLLHPTVHEALRTQLLEFHQPPAETKSSNQTSSNEPRLEDKNNVEFSLKGLAEWVTSVSLNEQRPDALRYQNLAPFFKEIMEHYVFTWDDLLRLPADDAEIEEAIGYISDTIGDNVPTGKEHYSVVLDKPFDLNGKGFAANVVAVLGANGALTPINESLAKNLFPSRGSAFISPSLLKGIPKSSNYFPAKLIRSQTGGANDYRVESHWTDVAELIRVTVGLDQIELLHDELKSFSFTHSEHQIWFQLPDGALISPRTRKEQLVSTSFRENWQYIAAKDVPAGLAQRGYLQSSHLEQPSVISMDEDSTVHLAIEKAGSEPISPALSNRLNYLLKAVNESDRTGNDAIELLINQCNESPPIRQLLDQKVEEFVQQRAGQIAEVEEAERSLKESLHELDEKLIERKQQVQEFEKQAQERVKKALKASSTTLTALLDDPLVRNIVQTSMEHAPPLKPSVVGNAADLHSPVPTIEIKQVTEQRSNYKKHGVRIESEDEIRSVYEAITNFSLGGPVPRIYGPGATFFATQVFAHAGSSVCSVTELLFAENISLAKKALVSKAEDPSLILETSEVSRDILANEMRLRLELGNPSGVAAILVINDVPDSIEEIFEFIFSTRSLDEIDFDKPISSEELLDFLDDRDTKVRTPDKHIIRRMDPVLLSWLKASLVDRFD